MGVAKPYRFMLFGDIHGPTPCYFIGYGALDIPKPYKLIWSGDIHGPKPYEFIELGAMPRGPETFSFKRRAGGNRIDEGPSKPLFSVCLWEAVGRLDHQT